MNIRRKLLVFVDPVVKHAERAHNKEGIKVLVFAEVCAECNHLQSLSQTHFISCEMIGYARCSLIRDGCHNGPKKPSIEDLQADTT
jgi:hypothetical protein